MKNKFEIVGPAKAGKCDWCGAEAKRVGVVYMARVGSPMSNEIPFFNKDGKRADISPLVDGVRWKPDSHVQKDHKLECTRLLCQGCVEFNASFKRAVDAAWRNAKRRKRRWK